MARQGSCGPPAPRVRRRRRDVRVRRRRREQHAPEAGAENGAGPAGTVPDGTVARPPPPRFAVLPAPPTPSVAAAQPPPALTLVAPPPPSQQLPLALAATARASLDASVLQEPGRVRGARSATRSPAPPPAPPPPQSHCWLGCSCARPTRLFAAIGERLKLLCSSWVGVVWARPCTLL